MQQRVLRSMEEWRPVPAELFRFEASTDGRIRNCKTGKILKIAHGLHHNTLVAYLAADQLIASAFQGLPPPDAIGVLHADGDRKNSRPENLIWRRVWFKERKHQEQQQALDRRALALKQDWDHSTLSIQELAEKHGLGRRTLFRRVVRSGFWRGVEFGRGNLARWNKDCSRLRTWKPEYGYLPTLLEKQLYLHWQKLRPCQKCGNIFHPCMMDWDHVDPASKKFKLAECATRLPTFFEIDKELSKCRLLCANCHRVISAQQARDGNWQSGIPGLYTLDNRRKRAAVVAYVKDRKEGRSCQDCGRCFPPEAMDFDHRPGAGKKRDVSRCISVSMAAEEIKKCDLVCANCHRKRTHDRRGNSVYAKVHPQIA